MKPAPHSWLLYCRPGFERDCAQEALRQARQHRPIIVEQPLLIENSGYVIIALDDQPLDYRSLIFTRQLIRLHDSLALPARDRLTPILAAIAELPGTFGTLWLEVPDTNDGKTLSTFTKRFQPLLEKALIGQGKLLDPATISPAAKQYDLERLHIFFPDMSSALIGSSSPANSMNSPMGIYRQAMPPEAPSRSTLKLAEAIEVFLGRSEQPRLLRQGMHAVDLGASPGGWTWQLVRRGIHVTAVDNGPMKGVLARHPLVQHVRQDGFKYAPRKPVDWLVCDIVEKPSRVAALIGSWFVAGWCKHTIFNLKLPMKQRLTAVDSALGNLRQQLEQQDIPFRMLAKQLYHDREEITIFLTRSKG